MQMREPVMKMRKVLSMICLLGMVIILLLPVLSAGQEKKTVPAAAGGFPGEMVQGGLPGGSAAKKPAGTPRGMAAAANQKSRSTVSNHYRVFKQRRK
jgi:hypothetical protein